MRLLSASETKTKNKTLILIELKLLFINNFLHFVSNFFNLG